MSFVNFALAQLTWTVAYHRYCYIWARRLLLRDPCAAFPLDVARAFGRCFTSPLSSGVPVSFFALFLAGPSAELPQRFLFLTCVVSGTTGWGRILCTGVCSGTDIEEHGVVWNDNGRLNALECWWLERGIVYGAVSIEAKHMSTELV